MNKVVPYPSTAELHKRAYDLVIVDRPAVGIEEKLLDRPRAQMRRGLEAIASKSGVTLIDRSLADLGGLPTEGELGDLEGRESEDVTDADYALATTFSTYGHSSIWKEPLRMPWQSPEEIANKPGTCVHTAEVEVDVQLVEIGSDEKVHSTYALDHAVEKKNKDVDPACPIASVSLGVLFEKAIDEALSCLEIPIRKELAPRGHLTGHRKASGAERHIYRISLGSVQGIEVGDEVEIRREQRSMSPSGEESRSERVIVTGEVTDQVMSQESWVAADPSRATDMLLDGDVVRPVFSEGLLSSLSGPDCDEILTER